MSGDFEKQVAEAQRCLDALLATPTETLREWAQENPEQAAKLREVLYQSISEVREEGKTKSGDKIGLDIDRSEDRYTATYCGLVGYSAVTFHCVDAMAASKLFEAFKNVDDIEAD